MGCSTNRSDSKKSFKPVRQRVQYYSLGHTAQTLHLPDENRRKQGHAQKPVAIRLDATAEKNRGR